MQLLSFACLIAVNVVVLGKKFKLRNNNNYYSFHNWINKVLSEDDEVPRQGLN